MDYEEDREDLAIMECEEEEEEEEEDEPHKQVAEQEDLSPEKQAKIGVNSKRKHGDI